MEDFLTYKDVISPPPLPAFTAILLVLGFKYVSDFTYKYILKTNMELIEKSASFLLVLGIASGVIPLLSLIFGISIIAIKLLSYLIVFFGILEAIRIIKNSNKLSKLYYLFFEQTIFYRICIIITGVILLGLFLSALGPPTDADSLDYHLGAPLEYLRNGFISPRYDWFHYRLSGSGEILNMIGLAAGTDSFGAVLQYSGLIIILFSLIQFVKTKENKLLFSLLILSSPVLLFLIPNQKPQFLPSAAIIIALIMVVQKKNDLRMKDIVLAAGCIFVAMASKYTYYISGAVIGIILIYYILKTRRKIISGILVLIILYIILLFPMQYIRFKFYSDPFSPILAFIAVENGGPLDRFSTMLKSYRNSTFIFPINLILPDTFGRISTVIGTGVVYIIYALNKRGKENKLLIASAILIGILYFLNGARVSRYYFEIYIWLALVAANINYTRIKKLFEYMLLAQATGMAIVALFGAYSLFPGALTTSLREEVLLKRADYYSVLKWVNKQLPEDSVILTTFRAGYFSPRRFMNFDIINYTDFKVEAEQKAVVDIMKSERVDKIVTDFPISEELKKNLGVDNIRLLTEPVEFYHGVRNPFNTGSPFKIGIYQFDS